MKNILKIVVLLFCTITVLSCDNDENNEVNGESRIAVRLTDAPGDYDEVNIDVQSIELKYNNNDDDNDDNDDNDNDNDDNNTVVLDNFNAGIYNLLELTGGVSVLLSDDEIPAGDISQIRLILGEENTVVVDGVSLPLATPSAQQSGLKIQLNQTLENDVLYEFLLDFDVERSIVAQGNGNYLLKPTIRASLSTDSGQIIGTVTPLGPQVVVTANNATVEISTYTNDAGEFLLSGLPTGTYTVLIEADPDANLENAVIEDVSVTNEETTDLGTINLE